MAKDGAIVPLFGTGIKGFSYTVSSQRRVNVYVEMAKDPEKGPLAVFGRPGLTTYPVPLWTNAFPLTRGMLESFFYETAFDGLREQGLVICGDVIYTVSPNTVGQIGVLGTNTGPVGMAKNATQVLLADGQFGYYIDLATLSKVQITATWFPTGATSVCFLNQRGIAVEPNSGRFWYSDLNDFDSGGGLNFYTAESDPDDLRVVTAHYGQLALFGAFTTEFWAPGSGTTAFQRVGGAALQWGVAAPRSVKQVDQGTVFVGQNRLGDKKVLLMQGYNATPLSDPALEYDLRNANLDAATAATYTVSGHSFYRLNLPDRVWVYDLTSKTWNEETTGAAHARGIGELCALICGKLFMSDYRPNGNLYYVDPDCMTDGGEVILRESVTRHSFNNYDRTSVDKLGLEFQTGVGLASGQGSAPKIMLGVSRNYAQTYGNEIPLELGEQGDYLHRVWAGPFGRSRNWTFRIRMSDPVKFALVGGSLKVRV